MKLQAKKLHSAFDKLQKSFGHPSLKAIYGAGCIRNSKVMFVFMNPTGRNIASHADWQGLRAPWLGTKTIWQMFYELRLISRKNFLKSQSLKPNAWSRDFAKEIYKELSQNKAYVTNLAKCTQMDARPLKNLVFKQYLGLMLKEIQLIAPANIVTLGNQVSSIVLGKSVSVNRYAKNKKEVLQIGTKRFNVYPTHYPVGQGRKNMPLAIKRIRKAIV